MGDGFLRLEEQRAPYKLFLRHHLSPGDVLVLSAAVESLHLTYPGRYRTAVDTTCMEIWKGNPRIERIPPNECSLVECHYPAIHEAGSRHIHFMAAFCEYLGEQLGVPLPLKVNRPCLYLDDREREIRIDGTENLGPYVVVNAGTKDDYTCKWAGEKIWQEVVDHFDGRIAFVQVGEGHHHHPRLRGAVDFVGRTNARGLFRLAHHATAAIGPVSFLLHICAALQRPYVALAGGREDPTWESYSSTTYLHTMGLLPCCREKACWKSRTVCLDDRSEKNNSLCSLPVLSGSDYVPRCLDLIGSRGVIEALERILRS